MMLDRKYCGVQQVTLVVSVLALFGGVLTERIPVALTINILNTRTDHK